MHTHYEDGSPRKSIIEACVKITMIGGSNYYYRYVDKRRAHRMAGLIAKRMVQIARGEDVIPVLESTILMDEFVEFKEPHVSRIRADVQDKVGFGKVEYSQSCLRVDQIAMVAVVCPGCGLSIMDSMPGHIIDPDDDPNAGCSDPLIGGAT